ncbi:MAG TPA: putative baseplate assembly protein [Polyangiaceae bacterium]|nr:putative baseplate assembly protein [Polyangiaceae bacterium]
MFVPLPELDDRRFRDLVDEARSLIPTYSPSWTDHNAHDPGITIVEVLAWVAETDIFTLDRIPERHRRAFLALLGIEPEPARPAQAIVQFGPTWSSPVRIPAGADLAATLLDGEPGVFQTIGDLEVQPTALLAVQVQSGGRFTDQSGAALRGRPFAPLGDDPRVGDAVYLGFDAAVAAGATLRLELELAGEGTGSAGRQRIEEEVLESMGACSPRLVCSSEQQELSRHRGTQRYAAAAAARHHSALVVWETLVAPGVWEALEVQDDTRAASLSGTVHLRFTHAPRAQRLGAVDTALYYVRGRLSSGALDVAPVATQLRANAARVRQVTRATDTWLVAEGVVVGGAPPPRGALAGLSFETKKGELGALHFDEPGDEGLCANVFDFRPASNQGPGRVVVGAVRVGEGDGSPNQLYAVPGPHVDPASFRLYTLENGAALRWRRSASLRDRGPAERVFVLDAGRAEVSFGDGQHGRVPPAKASIVVIARSTAGATGNGVAGSIHGFAITPHNAAWQNSAPELAAHLPSVTNPTAATGGSAPESLRRAEARALASVQRAERAVTLADCEQLALETPGTRIARAAARANCIPGLDCYSALGFISVVIVPYLPKARPVPSPGLLTQVSRYLERRRILGTRIIVTGPEYLEVSISAEVRAFPGRGKAVMRAAIDAALQRFLDPLSGGPDGTGWELGRDVYVSEVLDTISRVPGVDHVTSLEIVVPGCGGQCGDVCVRPLALVVSGTHRIVVS